MKTEREKQLKRESYRRNREACLARTKAWREANPARVKANRKRYYEANREAIKAKARAWEIANPDKKRRRNRARHFQLEYGLSVEDHARMMKVQAETCALCRAQFSARLKPHVDHNHTTGHARALLCQRCNHSLGHVEKGGGLWLSRALQYLAHHHSKSVLEIGVWDWNPEVPF